MKCRVRSRLRQPQAWSLGKNVAMRLQGWEGIPLTLSFACPQYPDRVAAWRRAELNLKLKSIMKLDGLYSKLTLKTNAKLVLVVLDGLGDLATKEQDYLTPLEAATTPNLDALTQDAAQGRLVPVAPGITPGSGPGHLGLFGYDPLEFEVGRGVIEALGLGLELKAGDIAARANFCALDKEGIVTDRRAGRIETPVCEELCAMISKKVKKVGDAEVIIRAGKGHRFVVIFRGKGLEGPLTDADPHREGLPVPKAEPMKSAKAKKAAALVAEFFIA